MRYNLSIDDGSRTTGGNKPYFSPTFSITGETTQDSQIYRNLIIVPRKADPKMDTRLLAFGQWGGNYPANTQVRENVFVVKSGQKGTFAFERAKKVLLADNRFYGDIATITDTAEVTSRDNLFHPQAPTSITLRGPKQDLQQFRDFLETKGNPYEKHGVSIEWSIQHQPDAHLHSVD